MTLIQAMYLMYYGHVSDVLCINASVLATHLDPG
jgi:hypothetical protein